MPDTDGPGIATQASAPGRGGHGLTRREGLLALAVLAPAGLLAACSGSSGPIPGSASPTTPPADLAAEVAAEETALIAAYDAVLAGTGLDTATTDLLTLIRDQHAQHRDSLGGAADGPTPSSPASSVTGLIAAERDAARARIRACVAADDADLARLLAFIGASEASHVPALRDLPVAGA